MINSIEREFAQAMCNYPMGTISVFLSHVDGSLVVMIFNLLVEREQSFMLVTYPHANMDLFDAATIVLDTLTKHLGHTEHGTVFPYKDYILDNQNEKQYSLTRLNCHKLYQGERFDHFGDRPHFKGSINLGGTMSYEGEPFVCPL
jgi:hypothetical protein